MTTSELFELIDQPIEYWPESALEAYEQGIAAYDLGKQRYDNRYTPGSHLHDAWERGWRMARHGICMTPEPTKTETPKSVPSTVLLEVQEHLEESMDFYMQAPTGVVPAEAFEELHKAVSLLVRAVSVASVQPTADFS